MSLDNRKKTILKAVIDDYIATAEPVGSKSLVEKYALALSPATVRNTMAELEQQGYLESPHTSAGRVPSDKGYRAYVDSLVTVAPLDVKTRDNVRKSLQSDFKDLPDLLKSASSVLSTSTGYTSVALTPRLTQSQLSQIKMLMIEPGRALVVVVVSAGLVKDRLVRIPDLLDAEQLRLIAQAAEQNLAGMPLEDITLVTVATALQGVLLPESLLNQVLYETYVSIKQAENLETYVDGVPNIFSHPEFQSLGKARAIVDTLSQNGLIVGLMENKAPLKDTQEQEETESNALSPLSSNGNADFMIRIGQELALESMKDCSFVTSTYKISDKIVGSIGVVGPRRMEYSKVISQISFVREAMDELINTEENRHA